MITVAAIGVVAGRTLLRVIPVRTLHRIAAGVFAVLSIVFLVDAIRTVDIDVSVTAGALRRCLCVD